MWFQMTKSSFQAKSLQNYSSVYYIINIFHRSKKLRGQQLTILDVLGVCIKINFYILKCHVPTSECLYVCMSPKHNKLHFGKKGLFETKQYNIKNIRKKSISFKVCKIYILKDYPKMS